MSKKTGNFLLILLIVLPAAGAAGVYFAITKPTGEDNQPQYEPTTRFFVMNESEIVLGKPAMYRTILENQEGETIEYILKVRFAGEEIYDEPISLGDGELLNQSISFTPNVGGDYQKLEFVVYKDNQTYRSRVFQVLPAIDYSIAPKLSVEPPSLQNGDMENNTGWKSTGNIFTANYTTSEWSAGKRSYLFKASRGVKKGGSGGIMQNVSSEKEGFVSLSFDVKSDNTSYYLQSVVNDKIVWENITGRNWQRIKVPVLLKKSNSLEFRVVAKNDTKSGIVAWLDNIKFEPYSPKKIENIVVKKEEPQYKMQKKGNTFVYTFNSGEKLELKASKGNVDKGDAVYTAANKGDYIIFLGKKYAKVVPSKVNYLYPVLVDNKNTTLKMNEPMWLKNNYAITLEQIENQTLKFSISRNNRTLRDTLSSGNSTLEYWREIDDYKKQKVIQVTPVKIFQNSIVSDIIQYGDRKIMIVDSKYGEFNITSITDDSITMRNIQPIKVEDGKDISLMNGSIKIRV